MLEESLHPACLKSAWQLEVVIRSSPEGPAVTEEAVTESDVSDHKIELWREGCLRKGRTEVSIQDLHFDYRPIFGCTKGEDDGVCRGLCVEATMPTAERLRRDFSNGSFELVASRAANRLIAAGTLEPASQYYYFLTATRGLSESCKTIDRQVGPLPVFSIKEKRCPPISYVEVHLPSLLEKATSVDVKCDEWPVFDTCTAFELAEGLARKGAASTSAVETGGVLVGTLGSCPETEEFFCLVTDVIELQGAQQSQFSLRPMGETWKRIQTQLGNLNTDPGIGSYQILGECHGHPFHFAQANENTAATSAFVSLDDRLWHHCVFDRLPCQLCHIFGMNQRQQPVNKLYGLQDARLLERGYHLIDQTALDSIVEDMS